MPDVCCACTTGVRSFAKRLVTLLRHLLSFLPFVRLVRIAENIEISNRAFPTTLIGCNFPSRLGSASLLSLRTPFYEEEWNRQEFVPKIEKRVPEMCVCVYTVDFRKLTSLTCIRNYSDCKE